MDPDPDPACQFDLDPASSFQIKAQNLEKVLKLAHIPHIMAVSVYLQIDADPDTIFQFDADPSGSAARYR